MRTSSFRQSLRTAFARWADAANISFVEVAHADEADIVIGEQSAPRGHAFTNVALGQSNGSTFRPIVKSLICLNPEANWKVGFDSNLNSYDLVHTFTHEIGHAIGLDHPGARGHVMSFRYRKRMRAYLMETFSVQCGSTVGVLRRVRRAMLYP